MTNQTAISAQPLGVSSDAHTGDASGPLLTIGVPVYNGANYLAEALESLRSQTDRRFKVIIADNGSDDDTPHICQEYVTSDARFEYRRNATNLGARENFNRLARECDTRYFKWLAHDDLIHPTFVERCLAELESRPDIALCGTRAERLHADTGQRDGEDYGIRYDAARPDVRFWDQIRQNHSCFMVFGIVRTSSLQRTGLLRDHVGSDKTLLIELALSAPLVELPEYLMTRRIHPESYSFRRVKPGARLNWWASTGAIPHETEDLLGEIYEALISEADIDPRDRRRCSWRLAAWRRVRAVRHLRRTVVWPTLEWLKQWGPMERLARWRRARRGRSRSVLSVRR